LAIAAPIPDEAPVTNAVTFRRSAATISAWSIRPRMMSLRALDLVARRWGIAMHMRAEFAIADRPRKRVAETPMRGGRRSVEPCGCLGRRFLIGRGSGGS
jgi:hypothetical protein